MGNILFNKCLLCDIQKRKETVRRALSKVFDALIAKLQCCLAPLCHSEGKYLHSQQLKSSANVLTALKWMFVFHFKNPLKSFLFLDEYIGK